jgi:hypothetical protein
MTGQMTVIPLYKNLSSLLRVVTSTSRNVIIPGLGADVAAREPLRQAR